MAQMLLEAKEEQSLDEVRWQHLRMYTALAPTNRVLFLLTGLTYRQASALVEKHFYNQHAQASIRQLNKGLPPPPPFKPVPDKKSKLPAASATSK